MALMGQGFADLLHTSIVFDEFIRRICELRFLIVSLRLAQSNGKLYLMPSQFKEKCLAIEGELSGPITITTTTINHSQILQCCHISCLVFIRTVLLGESHVMSTTLTTFGASLRAALEETDLTYSWGKLSKLLLWVLFMGSTATMGRPLYSWYMDHFMRTAASLQLQNQDQCRDCLRKFLWLETVSQTQLRCCFEILD